MFSVANPSSRSNLLCHVYNCDFYPKNPARFVNIVEKRSRFLCVIYGAAGHGEIGRVGFRVVSHVDHG